MKLIRLPAKLALLWFTFSILVSCQKDYLCKCDVTHWDENGVATNEWYSVTYDDPKFRSKRKCMSMEKDEKTVRIDCDFSELE